MTEDFTSIAPVDGESRWVTGSGGTRLRLYRMHGAGRGGPPILVGHCNGFAAGCYLPLLCALAVDHDVYAFDHRGHGGSEFGVAAAGTPLADSVAGDVHAVIAAVAGMRPDAPVHYVGHSLSAAALLHLAITRPADYRALPLAQVVLIEPPVFPDEAHAIFAECTQSTIELLARTLRRRRRWITREAYVAALNGRGPFAAFASGMLAQVAAATLRPSGDGFELACAPETEAAIFSTWGRPILFPLLGQVSGRPPMTLVGGDPQAPGRDWVTAVMPSVAARLGEISFLTMTGHGHLWPFEAPKAAVSLFRELVSGNLQPGNVDPEILRSTPPPVA